MNVTSAQSANLLTVLSEPRNVVSQRKILGYIFRGLQFPPWISGSLRIVSTSYMHLHSYLV